MDKNVKEVYEDFMQQRNTLRQMCGYEEKQAGTEEVFPEKRVFRLKQGRVKDVITQKVYTPKSIPEMLPKGSKLRYLTACLIQFIR